MFFLLDSTGSKQAKWAANEARSLREDVEFEYLCAKARREGRPEPVLQEPSLLAKFLLGGRTTAKTRLRGNTMTPRAKFAYTLAVFVWVMFLILAVWSPWR